MIGALPPQSAAMLAAMRTPSEYLAQADAFRRFATGQIDPRLARALLTLAHTYDRLAGQAGSARATDDAL